MARYFRMPSCTTLASFVEGYGVIHWSLVVAEEQIGGGGGLETSSGEGVGDGSRRRMLIRQFFPSIAVSESGLVL
jgi:hypothetical protein